MAYVCNPATLRLAVWISVLGVVSAVALEAAGWNARPMVIVAVMIGGVWASSVRTSRLPPERPSWQAIRLPVVVDSGR